jgi:hypothetical protein
VTRSYMGSFLHWLEASAVSAVLDQG